MRNIDAQNLFRCAGNRIRVVVRRDSKMVVASNMRNNTQKSRSPSAIPPYRHDINLLKFDFNAQAVELLPQSNFQLINDSQSSRPESRLSSFSPMPTRDHQQEVAEEVAAIAAQVSTVKCWCSDAITFCNRNFVNCSMRSDENKKRNCITLTTAFLYANWCECLRRVILFSCENVYIFHDFHSWHQRSGLNNKTSVLANIDAIIIINAFNLEAHFYLCVTYTAAHRHMRRLGLATLHIEARYEITIGAWLIANDFYPNDVKDIRSSQAHHRANRVNGMTNGNHWKWMWPLTPHSLTLEEVHLNLIHRFLRDSSLFAVSVLMVKSWRLPWNQHKYQQPYNIKTITKQ